MGGGGFVAGPAGLAATLTRTPLVLTEADSHLGLANRLLAGRARRVCLAFPIDGREGERYLVTGRPVPAAVLGADRDEARQRFGIPADARCLLVVGGSQGARSINFAAVAAFAEQDGRDFHVLHLSGRRDFEQLEARLAKAPHRQGYTLLPYEPDLGDVLAASDLVLGRSGGSIFEVTAAGRPAILVPYPHATADHQSANAAWMARAGAATVLADEELSARAPASPRSAPCSAIRRGCGRWRPRHAGWRSPTPRGASPTRSWRRLDERGAKSWRRRDERRSRSQFCPVSGYKCDTGGVGGAAAALHRHRRRRDERPRAGLRPARRHRHRQRPFRLLLYGAPARRRPRAGRRPRRRQPPGGRRGRRLDRDRRRQPGARPRPRARDPADPPRRPAGRALRREAADRDRRHPRQDDDDGDGGLGAARRSAPTRPSSSAARCRGWARTRPPPTPAGARGSGSSPRPTRATPASSS